MANEVNPTTLLTTALREIRALNKKVEELTQKVTNLSAGHTRKVSITEYSKETGLSNRCVRERIFSGVLNAEKIGGKYYIHLPA
jgi:hypothetical protein